MLKSEMEEVAALARKIAKEEIAAAIKELTPAPVKQPAAEEPAAKGGKK